MSAFIRNCFWMAQDVKNLLWPSQLSAVVRGRDYSDALVRAEEARDHLEPGDLPGVLFEPADETDAAGYLSWGIDGATSWPGFPMWSCANCGKESTSESAAQARYAKGLFCSAACADAADEPPLHTFCQKCGNGYINTHTCLREAPQSSPVSPAGANPGGVTAPPTPPPPGANVAVEDLSRAASYCRAYAERIAAYGGDASVIHGVAERLTAAVGNRAGAGQ